MTAESAISRKHLSRETGIPEGRLRRMRSRGEVQVETAANGRSARWRVSAAEVERLKRLKSGEG